MPYPAIDYNRVFARVPEIMGLPDLVFRGNAWEGKYYITGEPHRYRRDKLKVKLHRGIWVHEQGSESLPLLRWLVEYGGCADYAEAFRVIRGGDAPVRDFRHERAVKPASYVPASDVAAMRGFGLRRCPLFAWMSGMFGAGRTAAVWERYGAMSDGEGNAVFWYADAAGRVCHDKRMAYLAGGHRDKSRGAFRRYRTGDGYVGRCLFGEHLIGNSATVDIVESEKSALLAAAEWGFRKGVWVATGGKSQLPGLLGALSGKDVRLFPDFDAREEWGRYGHVVEWWDCMPDAGGGADIGDFVVSRHGIE